MERQDAINALTEKDNGLDQAVATPETSQPDSEADSMYEESQKRAPGFESSCETLLMTKPLIFPFY